MTSTLVKDSVIGDDWIKQVAANVPVQRIIGADGLPTGDILTGPVRLTFCEKLFSPGENDEGTKSYQTAILFTPLADMSIFYEEYYAVCGREFPQNFANGQYHGLQSPFKDQAEKAAQYSGFTPGCVYMNVGSQFQPPIVDSRYNQIVDEKKVYPGVWAILGLKAYAYGKAGKTKDGKPMKKGVNFGLQTVMIIGDDTRFGGGAPDPKKMYAGIKVPTAVVRPDIAQGMPMGGPPMQQPVGVPGYTMPSATPPQQGFMPPGAPPVTPGYQPQQNYGVAPVPSATTSPSEEDELRALGL